MKIAHVESSLNWGGQELRIIEQMEWLEKNGHPVWLIAREPSEIMREARKLGLRTFAMEIRNAFNPVVIYQLIRLLKKHQIDILDVHSSKESTQAFFVKQLYYGAKVIRSRHITNTLKRDVFHKLLWKYGNARVITTAQKIKDELLSLGVLDESRIDVAIAGVDEKRFNPQLRAKNRVLKNSLAIPDNHIVVANIGMLRVDKGQLFFLRACNEIAKQIENISFIQVGEATAASQVYKQQLFDEIAQLEHGARIHFLGYKNDIENYLAMSDIVIISSIATEAQSRLVVQAFLSKTAVVATTVGGLPEMITHRQNGLLCAPKSVDAIEKAVLTLIRDEQLRQHLCENAFNHALSNLTFDKMMAEMLDSYRKALF